MSRLRLVWVSIFTLTTFAHAGTCNFSPVGTRTQQLLSSAGFNDAGIMIGSARGILYKQYFGNYEDATIIPVASASKLLSGVRIMQLVDQGRIDLDTPVATYLPEFTDTKGTMTMRQMFSHTAGYGDDEDSLVLAADTTLADDVAYIAAHVDQPYPPPGSYFAYGGISMQVGGEVAHVQSGEDWQAGLRTSARRWESPASTGRDSNQHRTIAFPKVRKPVCPTMHGCSRCWPVAASATAIAFSAPVQLRQ